MDINLKIELIAQLEASEEELDYSSRRLVNQTVTEKKVIARIKWVREAIQQLN